ncbi:MAG: hypothetical protein C0392_05725 [Syntrophus sp. (in: bacteria)]|nr:hypothetical protein [Syntrophus sp. (in: bacteria)]
MTKKRDDTVRDSIIETSIKQFLAKGFVGTSVIEISRAVGIAKGTVYCHFESKEQILDSILDKYAKEFLDGAIDEVSKCEGDFLTRFKVFFKYTTEFGRDHRELMLVWHTLLGEIIGNSSETERKMKEIQGRYTRFLEGLLEGGKKEGMIGKNIDTLIHARIIIATLTGMLLVWYIESPPTDDENKVYVRAFREAILKGMEMPERHSVKKAIIKQKP